MQLAARGGPPFRCGFVQLGWQGGGEREHTHQLLREALAVVPRRHPGLQELQLVVGVGELLLHTAPEGIQFCMTSNASMPGWPNQRSNSLGLSHIVMPQHGCTKISAPQVHEYLCFKRQICNGGGMQNVQTIWVRFLGNPKQLTSGGGGVNELLGVYQICLWVALLEMPPDN